MFCVPEILLIAQCTLVNVLEVGTVRSIDYDTFDWIFRVRCPQQNLAMRKME